MSDFITLACPSCGGNLSLTKDAERFACPYCKREHLVRRSGGHVSLVPMIEKLERITEGVDRHASELAIQRLRKDKQGLKARIEDQQKRIRNIRWKRTEAKRELASKRNLRVVMLMIAGATGTFAIGLFIAANATAVSAGICFLLMSAATGLVSLISHAGIGKRAERIEQIQNKLDDEYEYMDKLVADMDRIEAELEHHKRVVSL